jgi:hypothetical protein
MQYRTMEFPFKSRQQWLGRKTFVSFRYRGTSQQCQQPQEDQQCQQQSRYKTYDWHRKKIRRERAVSGENRVGEFYQDAQFSQVADAVV